MFSLQMKNVIFVITLILNNDKWLRGSVGGIFALEEQSSNGRLLPKPATFHFPEYAYKETSKNEITYHEFEAACEHHTNCNGLDGIQLKSCTRRCISYACYQDIYAFDELEEGEIDVRLNSFKGCVIQRSGNTNHRTT